MFALRFVVWLFFVVIVGDFMAIPLCHTLCAERGTWPATDAAVSSLRRRKDMNIKVRYARDAI